MSHRRSVPSMRRFYDWFHRYYGAAERVIGPALEEIITQLDPTGTRYRQDSFLELACGSANLGLALAPRVAAYRGLDQSERMLERARARWTSQVSPALRARLGQDPFANANLTELDAASLGQPDWIAISYALHLFSPAEETRLLTSYYQAARKGVLVIDHEQRWSFGAAVAEWLEGSWYDQYVRLDFAPLAASLGARFRTRVIASSQVIEFVKPD